MRQSPMLRCMAVVDAMTKGDSVGIGGWISTSSHFSGFSEVWSITKIRNFCPFLSKTAQAYIACFETVAACIGYVGALSGCKPDTSNSFFLQHLTTRPQKQALISFQPLQNLCATSLNCWKGNSVSGEAAAAVRHLHLRWCLFGQILGSASFDRLSIAC